VGSVVIDLGFTVTRFHELSPRYDTVFTLIRGRLYVICAGEMDTAIILLCGVPGAGKTTLARQLCNSQYEEMENETPWGFAKRVVVERVSFDELYEGSTTSTATFDPVHWKHTQKKMVRIIMERLSRPRSGEGNVCRVLLADDNFYYRSMRKRFYQIAQEGKVACCLRNHTGSR
jgi:tRNA uridine 5-carbamoylmethylation protein Kti12